MVLIVSLIQNTEIVIWYPNSNLKNFEHGERRMKPQNENKNKNQFLHYQTRL